MNYKNRISKLVAKFDELGVGGYLQVRYEGAHLDNVFYLSGFRGSAAVILITPRENFFFTDSRYIEAATQIVSGAYTLGDNTNLKLKDYVLPKIKQLGLAKVAFDARSLSYALYAEMEKDFGGDVLVPADGVVEKIREVKEPDEIALVQKAIDINEEVCRRLTAMVGPNVTERDLASEHEYLCRKLGALSSSFSQIVASGPNSSKPHAGFTDSPLIPNTPLTFDIGANFEGYASDMTRTYFYKDASTKWEKIYGVVKTAKDEAAKHIKAGAIGKDVDKVARDIIGDAGYGDCFGHGLGHGIGIEVHEAPRLSKTYDQPLPEGALVTDEPGIYVPGEGGVRIEDIYLVGRDGATNLNHLPTELQVVG